VIVGKLYIAARTYMILGVLSGLAYREFTKVKHFTGDTQLSVLHTHLLALGMLFFLIVLVLVLEKLFTLSASKLFGWFFWTYNAGLALTVAMMSVHGAQTVLGAETGEAFSAIAGPGHIVLTVGLILFFINLGKRIPKN
jgi:hypothetical protein